MADRKTVAIALGTAVGAAVVGTAILVYSRRNREPRVPDINEIFDRARMTVRKLDEAVEMLRKSAAA